MPPVRARLLQRLRETPPLIFCTLALMAGVLLGLHAETARPFGLAAVLGLLGAILLPKRRLIAILLCICAVGGMRAWGVCHAPIPAEGAYEVTATLADNVISGGATQKHSRLRDISLHGESVPGQAYWSFYGEIPEGAEAGNRVRFTGRFYAAEGAANPGGFDFSAYLRQNGMRFGLYGAENFQAAEGSFRLDCLFARLRQRWTEALCRVMGEDEGAYAAAMLLGEKSLLDQQERQAFSRLGMAHLLAVSGFHVGVLAWPLERVLRSLRAGRRTCFAVTTAALAAYCLLTGGASSVVRAALLYELHSLGRLLRRRGDGMVLLSAAAFVILLVRPAQLEAAGFQLTFAAVAGIHMLAPTLMKLAQPTKPISRRLGQGLCVTLAAQAGTLLPVLAYFQQLPLLGIALNVLMLPWASGLICLYLLTLLCLPLPGVGAVMGQAAALATRALVGSVMSLAKLPMAYLWTPQPNVLTMLAVGTLAYALWTRSWLRGKARVALGNVAAICAAVSLLPLPYHGTSWVQLSVGNADAAVIRDENAVYALDAGKGDELALYLRQRRLSLDGLVLTHLQSDHAGGVEYLLTYDIPVKVCYLPWGAERVAANANCAALVERLRERGTEIRYLSRGDALVLPSGEMRVLWPEENAVRRNADPNDFCMATLWTLRGTTVLAMADVTGAYEPYAAAPCDILKAAHHGSEDSTGAAFAQTADPTAVLLSARKREHLVSLTERLPSAAVWATGTQGALTVDFTETGFTITPFWAREETE